MSPAALACSEAEHRRLVEEMSLLQLRKARELTQARIAEKLHMGKGDVTLVSFLQSVGADLE